MYQVMLDMWRWLACSVVHECKHWSWGTQAPSFFLLYVLIVTPNLPHVQQVEVVDMDALRLDAWLVSGPFANGSMDIPPLGTGMFQVSGGLWHVSGSLSMWHRLLLGYHPVGATLSWDAWVCQSPASIPQTCP
jgi:hypothetical protein